MHPDRLTIITNPVRRRLPRVELGAREVRARIDAKVAAGMEAVRAYLDGDGERPPEMGATLRWDVGLPSDRGIGNAKPKARGRNW